MVMEILHGTRQGFMFIRGGPTIPWTKTVLHPGRQRSLTHSSTQGSSWTIHPGTYVPTPCRRKKSRNRSRGLLLYPSPGWILHWKEWGMTDLETHHCVHHFKVDTPNGRSSRAVCNKCGAMRYFLNGWHQKGWTKSQQGKRSR